MHGDCSRQLDGPWKMGFLGSITPCELCDTNLPLNFTFGAAMRRSSMTNDTSIKVWKSSLQPRKESSTATKELHEP